MSADEISRQRFAQDFTRLVEWATGEWRRGESPFADMLVNHFGADPSAFPVTAETIAEYNLPNLQLALDAYLDREGTSHRLVGFGGPVEHVDLSLSGLVHDVGFGITLGPVRRQLVSLGAGLSPLTCVTTGLFLITTPDGPLAVLVLKTQGGFARAGIKLDVMAPEPEPGESFIRELRALMRQHNVYRGKVIALGAAGEMMDEGTSVTFQTLPNVQRADIVLPEGVLNTVELHTIEFSRHAERLRTGDRHLRRGLLLHGPPGTGKTLTASYLISCLEGRTVLILSGSGLSLIGEACSMARELAPALVILEDVDLVAAERMMGMGTTSLLFELMNEMDGIGEDADVIFLMTTNRADILEPALAARPGRVDQAVELPIPDADARARLLQLFSQGLEVRLTDRDAVVEATSGASPAFLRELVRKAALYSAVDGVDQVTDEHFRRALDMLEQGNGITRSILGAEGGQAASRLGRTGAMAEAFSFEEDEDEEWEDE